VARRLRISNNSAYVWRRRWRAGGADALASKGPGGSRCRLSASQLGRLQSELELGPAAHGWADQRWTLARVTALIGRLFHVITRCAVPPTCYTASDSPRRSRSTGRLNVTRKRSPRGVPRPGRGFRGWRR
jgi:putative transposase